MSSYTLPTVEAPSLEDLEVTIAAAPLPTSEDLIERLHVILRDAAPRRKRSEGEALEMGDEVDCDFLMEVDGQLAASGVQRMPRLEMREILVLPGLIEALVGMTPHSQKTVELDLPRDYPDPALANRRVTFHLRVREAFAVEMPELDDEAALAAAHLGSDIDEAMATISELIDNEQGEQLLVDATEAVLDALASRVTEEVPDEVVDEELRLGWLQGPGALLGEGFSEEQVEEARVAFASSPVVRADAVQRIKVNLALAALVESERLEPSAEVMTELLEAAALPLDLTLAELKKALASEPAEARKAVEGALYVTAVEFVMARAKVNVLDE